MGREGGKAWLVCLLVGWLLGWLVARSIGRGGLTRTTQRSHGITHTKTNSFHDFDIAPEGATLAESNKNLDEVVALALELQVCAGG